MPRWLTAIDVEDLRQERELARLEGRCPKQAVRAYMRQEHRFYDLICLAPLNDWTTPAPAPLPLPPPVRSPESIERRKAYSREWWRKNGREYRRRRKSQLNMSTS